MRHPRSTAIGAAARPPALGLLLGVLALAGCAQDRSRPTVPIFGDLVVASDPEGARILVNGQDSGVTTPGAIASVPAGRHLLELSFRSSPEELFVWRDSVEVPEEDTAFVEAALEGGCAIDCPFVVNRGRVVCRLNGVGDNCADAFFNTQPALRWPGPVGDYAAGGRLLATAILGDDAGVRAGDTLATMVFRQSWIGRGPVAEMSQGRRQIIDLEYWATSQLAVAPMLGLLVKQTVVAVDSVVAEDLVFLSFEVSNITDDPRYQRLHPEIPEAGFTFHSLFLGFGLDADIGNSGDDRGTFDPDLDLGFMYDADFQDGALGDRSDRPAIVGLVTVEPPQGAARRTLTLWRIEDDWDQGIRTGLAWRVLAGRLGPGDPIADHPSDEIGFVAEQSDDYRLTEAHGPLELAPGESVVLAVALVMGDPAEGTFTPGQPVAPGDPLNPGRTILTIADSVRVRAGLAAELWDRYRP